MAVHAGIDVGGTFTDVVVLRDDAPPSAIKVPTTPHDQSTGLGEGLRKALAEDGVLVEHVAHGTTTATNAILERNVARTVLVTTEGFRDVLEVARQDRPSLYDLNVVRPEPLVPSDHVVVARQRTAANGSTIVPLTDGEVGRVVEEVAALAPEAVAVSLLFSWADAAHEARLCAALARRLGDTVPITRSSDLLPEVREYERASTCVLDAAVAPTMRRYLGRVERTAGAPVTVMTSAGGTVSAAAAARHPVHTLLSGPAAGVVAAAAVAVAAGFPDAVAFDMGGTSTDVCLIRDGRPQHAEETTIGGLPLRTQAVAVHTVGAGGGSVAWVDAGGALRVGPRSAGAVPGPACYGRGGTEPTVTDAHCVLAQLGGAGGGLAGGTVRLDVDAARHALERLGDAGDAAGVLDVVRAAMGRALRRVSTEQGVDPAGLAVVAYGGAGPLHASALARDLGCAAVVVPPVPGVLSALGLLLAPRRQDVSRTVAARAGDDLADVWAQLEEQVRGALRRDVGTTDVRTTRTADCRYAGQSWELRVDAARGVDLAQAFAAAHRTAYGYALDDEPVELVTLRVAAEAPAVLDELPSRWNLGRARPPRATRTDLVERAAVPVLDRAGLQAGEEVVGPALVVQPDATTLLLAGDVATVHRSGSLVVRW